ncbi:bifunctional enoyl-CoA hydratase/phosphate acetyltransferase [Alkalicoccus urumqiensis]|uniref:Phosphate butyryltransferase n=1 Tax=Alkalicoccus urumqiensis TaxID=1548213 RepID=A0A2P6MKA0_ALKUR|nr:bifunctional enoyl-CoA hydratase/phosphate acetyltransferase [Alkalicoccus urumqiensis]PRO66722.1 phosphate butyryltransferase [Alkalicoccus urumqiensis]
MKRKDLQQQLSQSPARPVVAVAYATDASIFHAAQEAVENGTASFVFTGPFQEMTDAMEEASFSVSEKHVRYIDCTDEKASCETAVKLVSSGEADIVMKGLAGTSVLLKEVLNKEYGLRTGSILSHIAAFERPDEELIFLTDSAMNIRPSLEDKVLITENAVRTMHAVGITNPVCAVLAAVEKVNPSMQATLDAAALTQMNRRNQITGCTIDGPLGLDNALSEAAAAMKKIDSPAAGAADLLLAPEIETGNVLYKAFTYLGGASVGGMITGASAPVVLTSRTDSAESRLFSLELACAASLKNQVSGGGL